MSKCPSGTIRDFGRRSGYGYQRIKFAAAPSYVDHCVAVRTDDGKVGKRYFLAGFWGFAKLLFVMDMGEVAANIAVSSQGTCRPSTETYLQTLVDRCRGQGDREAVYKRSGSRRVSGREFRATRVLYVYRHPEHYVGCAVAPYELFGNDLVSGAKRFKFIKLLRIEA